MDIEKQILSEIRNSISDAIKTKLGGYNTPLDGAIKSVFESQKDDVIAILKSVFQEVIGSDEFRATIKEEFQRKVAKNLVGMLEGQVTKAADALKQDPTMKSRMILAIEQMVTNPNH